MNEKKTYQELVGKSRWIDVAVSQNMSKPLASIIVRFEEFYNQPRDTQPSLKLTFDGTHKTAKIDLNGDCVELPMEQVLETLAGLGRK